MVLVYVLCTTSQAIQVWSTAFFMKGAGLGMGLMHLCGYLLSWVHLIGCPFSRANMQVKWVLLKRKLLQ
jgi:hypothetical protein